MKVNSDKSLTRKSGNKKNDNDDMREYLGNI